MIKESLEHSKHRPISSFFMGMINIGLGKKDQVFAWLEEAFLERKPLLMQARPDPIVQDGLQTDPRYYDLLRRIGSVGEE